MAEPIQACRHCGRTEAITTAGGMKRHEAACKMNPAQRSNGAHPDTVALRVRKAADDQLADVRSKLSEARGHAKEQQVDLVLLALDAAHEAFAFHDKLVKLLEA